MIPFRRISSTLTALLLLLCFACACRQAPRKLAFQVIDAEGNPLPNVQVHYGISNPETFEFIGFTDENGSVVWNDPLTSKQNIYIEKRGFRRTVNAAALPIPNPAFRFRHHHHTTGGVGSRGKQFENHSSFQHPINNGVKRKQQAIARRRVYVCTAADCRKRDIVNHFVKFPR